MIMKKLLLFICLLATTATSQAQSILYNKTSQKSGIESFYYSQDMMRSAELKNIQNEDANLSVLDWRRIKSLEYLSATKRRAVRSLKKEGKKNIGKDSKVLMQINKKDHNLSIYKTARSSYLLINEAPKRYTIISLEGDIRPCSLSNIFTK